MSLFLDVEYGVRFMMLGARSCSNGPENLVGVTDSTIYQLIENKNQVK